MIKYNDGQEVRIGDLCISNVNHSFYYVISKLDEDKAEVTVCTKYLPTHIANYNNGIIDDCLELVRRGTLKDNIKEYGFGYDLYLDDERELPKAYKENKQTEYWGVVRSFDECVEFFNKNKVNILSLDHDLGVDGSGNLVKTGYDFVKYFVENDLYCNEIRFHTANPVGRANMRGYLLSAQKAGVISDKIKIGF